MLSNPLTRAEYILTLRGSPCSSADVPVADMGFLMEVMELNEQIDTLNADLEGGDVDLKELRTEAEEVHSHVLSRWEEEMAEVVKCLEGEQWDNSHVALSRVRYFERLRGRMKELKPKLAVKGVSVSFD